MNTVSKRGLNHASECGYIVPSILQNPAAVFEGLCQDDDEVKGDRGVGWRCYCGIPQCAYNSKGRAIEPYEDMVYIVFVSSDMIAYNWRWAPCDLKKKDYPKNYETRFKRQLL